MPKGPRKYDPKAVEHEYVTTDISLRALAAEHNVSFSSLAAYARANNWTGKRVAYASALSRRTYEVMAQDQGNIRASITEDSIKILRATLSVYAEQLAARKVPVATKDALETIKTLAAILGQEEGGAEDDRTVINVSQKLDADLLRGVAAAARGRLAVEGVLGGTSSEEPERTRLN